MAAEQVAMFLQSRIAHIDQAFLSEMKKKKTYGKNSKCKDLEIMLKLAFLESFNMQNL